MPPFTPVGERARWQVIYDLLTNTDTGDILSYREMALALGIDHKAQRHIIHQAMGRAAKEHEQVDKRAVESVRNQGYRVVQPEEHMRLAKRWQGKSSKALVAGRSKVVNVDFNALDPTTRQAFEVVAQAFALQMDFNRRMDVRQQRNEQAVAASFVRHERSETEIAELRQRLARLEHQRQES